MSTEGDLPSYIKRLSEVVDLLDALYYHPEGLTFGQLAREVNRPEAEVREALDAYYRADVVGRVTNPGHREAVIEFEHVPGDGPDDLGSRVVLVSDDPGRELGVVHRPAAALLASYRAGANLLQLEPENRQLRAAVEKLADTLLGGVHPSISAQADQEREFHQAARQNRRVRITYARAWKPGTVSGRVIDPYRLVHTRRDWEVDAGPPQDGRLRTFLLTGILAHEVLDQTFDPPDDLAGLLGAQRRTTPVDFDVRQGKQWAVDRQAERIEEVRADRDRVCVRAHLLEPLRERIGLILLDCGPDARVLTPAEFRRAGTELAARLLERYR